MSDGVEELVRDYITEENGDPETFGNARGVRNIFEHILVAQNNRLAAMETVTKEDLMTLTQDDVLHARGSWTDKNVGKRENLLHPAPKEHILLRLM